MNNSSSFENHDYTQEYQEILLKKQQRELVNQIDQAFEDLFADCNSEDSFGSLTTHSNSLASPTFGQANLYPSFPIPPTILEIPKRTEGMSLKPGKLQVKIEHVKAEYESMKRSQKSVHQSPPYLPSPNPTLLQSPAPSASSHSLKQNFWIK